MKCVTVINHCAYAGVCVCVCICILSLLTCSYVLGEQLCVWLYRSILGTGSCERYGSG